jgi:hypothetical protein
MAIGPGKYDPFCTFVREKTKAKAAIVIVVAGELGSGFSCQTDVDIAIDLPGLLEHIAQDLRKAQGAAKAEPVYCIYCGAEIENSQEVPAVQDDAAWETLARKHAEDCEWIATRAHRREDQP